MRTGAPIVLAVLLTAGPPGRLPAQCPDGSPPPCQGPAARAAAAPVPTSVAVLYFDNLSRDTADAYLADGLTEEIITRLGQVERLTVKSRAAVQRYRRPGADPLAAGRALGVAQLVSGSVRRTRNRVRVSVELVRSANGDRVWGDQYDRVDADLLVIEEDIARAVATAIAGRLLPAERVSLTSRPTRNPQAHDHFLRGNFYLAQRTSRGTARAIEEYEAAVRLDAGFTEALARIAYGYALMLYWGWDYPGVSPEGLLARGFAATDRALRQDSATSDAWMARAFLLTNEHPRTYEGTREAFERAVALDPSNAEAYHQYCGMLGELGEDSAAVAACRRALEIEPERPITLVQLAELSLFRRRYEEVRGLLDSALVVDPGFPFAYAFRATVHLHLGEAAAARADAQTAVRLSPGFSFPAEAALALVDVRSSDTVAARSRVERLVREAGDLDRPTSEMYWLGTALVALGEQERALDLLERVRPRGARLWYHLRSPEFDSIRAHPRYQRLVEEARPPRRGVSTPPH